MNLFEAIVLGIIQGLTEFLPVSSSGHLELGKHLFGIDPEANFYFSIAVHGATVLSTIFVLRREIADIFKSLFSFKMNDETRLVIRIVISMIPVAFAGLFMNDIVEQFFAGNMIFLGAGFFVTSLLLAFTLIVKPRERNMTNLDSFIIGISQALAVIPGISRSGSTIATGMMLGNRKSEIAKFSFLMVLIPVIGANILEFTSGKFVGERTSMVVIIAGFLAAFTTGYIACRWMINLVKKGNLKWFAVYCLLAGCFSILLGLNVI